MRPIVEGGAEEGHMAKESAVEGSGNKHEELEIGLGLTRSESFPSMFSRIAHSNPCPKPACQGYRDCTTKDCTIGQV